MPIDSELQIPDSADNAGRYHIPSISRALAVIEHLADQTSERTSTEIADALEVPRNSIYRILATLADHGYVSRAPDTKAYRLSRKILSVAYKAIDGQSLVERSMDLLRSLRDDTGETVLIGTLIGQEGIVIEQVPSNQPIKVLVEIGHRFPLHTAAPAKAMLAFLPDSERETIVRQTQFTRFTDRTCTNAAAFFEELQVVAKTGYALDRGEEVEDIICVAAPVFNHRSRPIASIWITGPKSRISDHDIEPIRRAVMLRARKISARLGYDTPDLPDVT